MRIALVVPDLRPRSGGPARNVPALAEALGEQGVEIEVHTTGPVPEPGSARVTYQPAHGLRPRKVGRSPEMLGNLRASRADLIHAHCLWMLPLGYAARAAQSNEVPLVISPRGMLAPWARRRSAWKKRLAERLIHPGAFRAAAAWHATSEQEARDIRALGHEQPVFVIPNGVAQECDPSAAISYYRARMPEADGRRVLLFYSRFHSKKRVLDLMSDFARVTEDRREWHLLLVGIPEQYSVGRLEAEARRLGIAGRVTVLNGLDAPRPYPVAELMALPTHDENFGQVVAEALCAGRPVITTTGTPWRELNERRAGRWVDPRAFAAELEALLASSPADLARAGERGREWMRAEFGWPGIGARMRGAYQQVLEGRSGRR